MPWSRKPPADRANGYSLGHSGFGVSFFLMANMDKTEQKIFKIIAGDIGAAASQVQAAVRLLDDGATVPFIARYRKEVTGSLNDTQLRQLEERLAYLRELEDRRRVILESVRDQ